MSQQRSQAAPDDDRPQGDPWHAFGYVVSGVAFYGFLGWLADRWLGTAYLVGVGILVGAGLGLYLTFTRFNRATPGESPQKQARQHDPRQQDPGQDK